MTALTLERKAGPPWVFRWNQKYDGFCCQQRKHLYRIFFDNEGGGIWIGVLVKTGSGGPGWVTIEQEIKAETLIMERGVFTFTERRGG